MEFEVLKRSHLKRNIIIGLVVIAIISAIVLNFTRAKYRVTESIPIVNGTINYTLPDLNVVALYIDGVAADSLDSNTNYTLDTTQSTCTYKDGSTIPNLTLNYDSETKAFSITPYTTKGTKCTLYFEEYNPIASDVILAGKDIQERSSFSSVLSTNTNGIIYRETTSDGTTYYFAGDTDENWVSFAGYYWRIIRINEDGSVRMIYNGMTTNQTGVGTQIQTSLFNSNSNRSYYVGYMYSDSQHGNGSNSTIKRILDEWYETNIREKNYDNYIADSGFCGDREMQYDHTWSATSSGSINYASYLRRRNTPTFSCTNGADLYTVYSDRGNRALTYPIGLITLDEVRFAGAFNTNSNTEYWLYTGQSYWTMSPGFFNSVLAYVYRVAASGGLNYGGVDEIYDGVRPVINLRADVTLTGTGTSTDPYTVVGV